MISHNERRIREIKPAIKEDNIIPYEKWIVAFSNPRKKSNKLSYREFFAQGFYEAYDTVMTYAEKLNVDIRWFKEKRNCGDLFTNHKFIELESFCTYCNNMFNHQDPIPCINKNCYSIFCSKNCMNEHISLLHRKRI